MGTNLVRNSSFEEMKARRAMIRRDIVASWYNPLHPAFYISNDALFGQTAIKVPASGNGSYGLNHEVKLGTSPFGRFFSFSFWAKLAKSDDQSADLHFYLAEDENSFNDKDPTEDTDLDGCLRHFFADGYMGWVANRTVTGEWQRFTTFAFIDDLNPGYELEKVFMEKFFNGEYQYCKDNIIYLRILSDKDTLVDGVQLEERSQSQFESQDYFTNYQDYGSANQVYLKKTSSLL